MHRAQFTAVAHRANTLGCKRLAGTKYFADINRQLPNSGTRFEVDEDLAARERKEDAFSETHAAPADLKQKVARARRQTQSR